MRLLRRLLWRLLSAGMWRHVCYRLHVYDAMNVTVCRMWRHVCYRLHVYDAMNVTVCRDVTLGRLRDVMEVTVSWDGAPWILPSAGMWRHVGYTVCWDVTP